MKLAKILSLCSLLLVGCKTVQPRLGNITCLDNLKVYTLQGKSMEPLICQGYKFYVDTSFPYDSLQAGDLVIYKNKASTCGITCHMLYERGSKDHWRTYGINNKTIDPWVMNKDDYLGKVVKVEAN